MQSNQDLASQNVPTGLLTRNNFRLARHPGSMHPPALTLRALCNSCVKLRYEIEGLFMVTEKLELSVQRCANR
jgi:hypothetical protein